jgi:hypothetical protein
MEDYFIVHVGEGQFKVKVDEEEWKDAGPNLCGMIRYTYFEDFTLPEVGWHTTRMTLLKDYQPKVMQDIVDGKIKPGKHEF